MKKISTLAFLALGMNSLFALESAPETPDKSKDPGANESKSNDPAYGNSGYYLMTDEELQLELNDEGLKLYQSLDDEGKKLAREVASARCNATNKCAGLNACADDTHSCAGKGKCQGQGKCAFSDKNLAVKVVAEKMAKKRADLLKEQEPKK